MCPAELGVSPAELACALGQPNVSDLSLLHQLLQTLHGLFDRGAGVHAVLIEEVYVIRCPQPLEGVRQLGPDQIRFAGECQTRGGWDDAELSCDDEVVSPMDLDGFAQELFIRSVRLTVYAKRLVATPCQRSLNRVPAPWRLF